MEEASRVRGTQEREDMNVVVCRDTAQASRDEEQKQMSRTNASSFQVRSC